MHIVTIFATMQRHLTDYVCLSSPHIHIVKEMPMVADYLKYDGSSCAGAFVCMHVHVGRSWLKYCLGSQALMVAGN